MADTDQLATRLEAFKRAHASRRIGKRHPTYHAGNVVYLARQIEKLTRLIEIVQRLHQNGASTPACLSCGRRSSGVKSRSRRVPAAGGNLCARLPQVQKCWWQSITDI